MKQRIVRLIGLVALVSMAGTVLADPEPPFNFEEKPWVESQTAIPAYPAESNLIEFFVGPTERNRFFIDGSTIAIGSDGIVRYVMVLETKAGARNVTLEAIRCATREIKLVAVGRSDATWDKIQAPQWRSIENKTINQYRAVLSRNFLCPAGAPPRDSAEARAALRRGKHPDAA